MNYFVFSELVVLQVLMGGRHFDLEWYSFVLPTLIYTGHLRLVGVAVLHYGSFWCEVHILILCVGWWLCVVGASVHILGVSTRPCVVLCLESRFWSRKVRDGSRAQVVSGHSRLSFLFHVDQDKMTRPDFQHRLWHWSLPRVTEPLSLVSLILLRLTLRRRCECWGVNAKESYKAWGCTNAKRKNSFWWWNYSSR